MAAAAAIALTVAGGCSAHHTESATTRPAGSRPTSTSASHAEPSEKFCGDLESFEASVNTYTDEVTLGAVVKAPSDLKKIRKDVADAISLGDGLQDSVPTDIAEDLRTVLSALKESRHHLTPSGSRHDTMAPVISKKFQRADNALENYSCY